MGSGAQNILYFIAAIVYLKSYDLILIDEPELHLHPEIARQFFDIIKRIAENKQTFITTHSTVFVDQADLTNTWIVRRENKESKVMRVQEPEDLRNILYELGLRPSDLFYSNSLIFVEGSTEKVVLPVLAKKMGIDFEESRISIIPTYGKSSGRYHLKVWTEVVKNTQIPYYMILDKGAEKEAKKFSELLRPDDVLFLLKRGSMEDYYPVDKLVDAIKSEYNLEITDEDKKKISESPRDKNIEELLRSKNKDTAGWKVIIGRRVSNSMVEEEIDEEIKRILERITVRLTVGSRRM